MVKVFRPGSGVGFGGGAGGTIAIYTKKGGDRREETTPTSRGWIEQILIGYSVPKEFYSPNYLVELAAERRGGPSDDLVLEAVCADGQRQ